MPANYLMGVAPTRVNGTQAAPLNSFYSASGATGNKTTNKDLPEWLRKLGMKGDAYAGGMLKPQIRYGFWFKDGKINFADGTSYAAKKVKGADGKTAYSYTGSDGKAATYSPTDEQNAYNKKYKDSTSNNSFFEKVGNTLGFEFSNLKNMIKDFDVAHLFGGVDPLGTKIGNAVTGRDAKPLVDQMGGALPERYDQYGKPSGFAKPLHDVAHTVAAAYGGAALGNLAGAGIKSLGLGQGGTGSGLGVFSNGGSGGLQGVGVGNAGRLAQSGAITGGAGVAGLGGGGSAGASGVGGASGIGGGSMGLWDNFLDILPALGSLYNSGQQREAAGDASRASQAGILAGIEEQRRQFDLSRQDQMPWLQAGVGALGRLQDPATNFTTSPGYAFTRAEGTRDIGNSFAARGGALSGNALRGLSEFNTGLASNEFNNWWNQQAGLAGVGQTSAQSLGALGQNSANNVSNLLQAGGNARASGIIDQSNAVTGGLNDLSGWYGNWRKRRGG